MTSILTNNGAMVALQTLKSINSNLTDTQNAISTGREVNSAKDNASVWAISKVMEADVSGFDAVQDSLATGQSAIGVASAGAELIVEKLTEMRDLAIASRSETTDIGKNQAEIAEKGKQIEAIINDSSFNGVNMLKTNVSGSATSLTVVSSVNFDNTDAASIAASTITVASADFEANVDISSLTAITTTATADTALAEIETMLTNAIDGAAALGASAKRIDDQSGFISKLSDSIKTGIGSLVDTDMEAASAKLQALQTQQQLGVQALSIANQAPQTILSLFR